MGRWMRFLGVLGLFLTLVMGTPARGADSYFATGVTAAYPGQYSDETVLVRLSWDYGGTQPISGVFVHTVWNYRTTTSVADGYTGSDGFARLTRNISGATCGYTVRVDIFAGTNGTQIDSAYFTPCGASASAYVPSYQPSTYQPPTYQPPAYEPTQDDDFSNPDNRDSLNGR